MTEYSDVAIFNGIPFALGDVIKRLLPGTLKTNVGKKIIETDIPFRNTNDVELQITGILDGRTYKYPTDLKATLEWEREQLENSQDGYKYAYSDDKHSFNASIRPGSLQFDDSANSDRSKVITFKMTIIEWSN